MKIATWNVWRLETRARRNAVAAWIATIDADVWVLTETDDEMSPGPDYDCVSTIGTDRPGRPGERWVSIWSRFPIEPLLPTGDPVRAVAALVRTPADAKLIVYGTVLPWLGSAWQGVPSAEGRAFRAALAVQQADWQVLRTGFPDADLCVAGDLNQDLAAKHYYGSKIGRWALGEALQTVGLVAITADQHDPVRAMAPDHASIDHICLPSGRAQLAAKTLLAWPPGLEPDPQVSDHFGVSASLGD